MIFLVKRLITYITEYTHFHAISIFHWWTWKFKFTLIPAWPNATALFIPAMLFGTAPCYLVSTPVAPPTVLRLLFDQLQSVSWFLGDSQSPPLARLLMWRWWWHFFSLRQTNSPCGPILASDTSKRLPECEHDYRQVWIASDPIWKFGDMKTWKNCKFCDLPCHLWLQKTKKRREKAPKSSYMHLNSLVVIFKYT